MKFGAGQSRQPAGGTEYSLITKMLKERFSAQPPIFFCCRSLFFSCRVLFNLTAPSTGKRGNHRHGIPCVYSYQKNHWNETGNDMHMSYCKYLRGMLKGCVQLFFPAQYRQRLQVPGPSNSRIDELSSWLLTLRKAWALCNTRTIIEHSNIY